MIYMIKFSRLSRLLTSVGVYCAVAIASLMCQPAMADTGDQWELLRSETVEFDLTSESSYQEGGIIGNDSYGKAIRMTFANNIQWNAKNGAYLVVDGSCFIFKGNVLYSTEGMLNYAITKIEFVSERKGNHLEMGNPHFEVNTSDGSKTSWDPFSQYSSSNGKAESYVWENAYNVVNPLTFDFKSDAASKLYIRKIKVTYQVKVLDREKNMGEFNTIYQWNGLDKQDNAFLQQFINYGTVSLQSKGLPLSVTFQNSKAATLDGKNVYETEKDGGFIVSGQGVQITSVEILGVGNPTPLKASKGSFSAPEKYNILDYESEWRIVWNAPTEDGVDGVSILSQYANNDFVRVKIHYKEGITYPYVWQVKSASEPTWEVAKRELDAFTTEAYNNRWSKYTEDGNVIYEFKKLGSEPVKSSMSLASGLKINYNQGAGSLKINATERYIDVQNVDFVIPNVPAGYRVYVWADVEPGSQVWGQMTGSGESEMKQFGNQGSNYYSDVIQTSGDYTLHLYGVSKLYAISVATQVYTGKVSGVVPTDYPEDHDLEEPSEFEFLISEETGDYYKKTCYPAARYEFIEEGYMPGAHTVTKIPGIFITFGTEHENWSVTNTLGALVSSVTGGAPANPKTGVPTTGTFYKLEPFVNGFLTIDGSYLINNNIVIVDQYGQVHDSYMNTEESKQFVPHKFSKPLEANVTYYVYSQGYNAFAIKNIMFNPAFLLNGEGGTKKTISYEVSYKDENNTYPRLNNIGESDNDSNIPKDKIDYIIDHLGYITGPVLKDDAVDLENDVMPNPVEITENYGTISFRDKFAGESFIYGLVYNDEEENSEDDIVVFADYYLKVTDKEPAFKYAIYTGEGNVGKQVKFTITNGGSIQKDLEVKMPGLNLVFPVEMIATNDRSKSAYNRNANGVVAMADNQVVIGEDGIPTGGTYYQLMPTVAGFLKLDASLFNRHFVQLICQGPNPENPSENIINTDISRTIRQTTGWHVYGEYQDSVLLLPGFTYYLFNQGTSPDPNNLVIPYSLELHGLTYTPAFVNTDQSNSAATEAKVKKDSPDNSMPFISDNKVREGVTFTSSNTAAVTISNDETVTFVSGNKASSVITCTIVQGDYTVSASYTLDIDEADPTQYKVHKGFTPKIGEAVTSIPNIKFTYGGWINRWSDKNINTFTYSDWNGKEKTVTDKYTVAASTNDQSMDGFAYATEGVNDNYTDEKLHFNAYLDGILNGVDNPFAVPCRGTFFTFEPKYDGNLTFYVSQNGIINGTTDSHENEYDVTERSPKRALYIIDERGSLVKPLSAETDGTYWYHATDLQPNAKAELVKRLRRTDISADSENFNDWYADNIYNHKIDVMLAEDGYGIQILEKSLMKYNIKVEAGKTYYIVGLYTKLGFAGFDFQRTNPTGKDFERTDETVDYADPGNISNRRPVISRTFKKDVWTPIILPYSMNADQVKKAFGDNVDIVYFDKIENKTIYYVRHYYQTIGAGQSCLVKPSIDNASLTFEKDFDFPYVTVTSPDEDVKVGTDYTWHPSYSRQTPMKGDYFYATDGTLKESGKDMSANALKGFRVLIKRNADAAAGAKILYSSFVANDEDEEVTDIKIIDAVDENNVANEGIYTIDGRKINRNINNLPHGVYIINGKKVIR